MQSQHAVTSMYVQKAVNVDEGITDNIKGAQAQIEQIAKRRAEEEAKKVDEPKDVEDDEWD